MRWYALLFIVVMLIFPAAVRSEAVSKVIVKVNDQVITSRDLDEYCQVLSCRIFDADGEVSPDDSEFRNTALERLIEDTLIICKAKQDGIEISPSRVEDKLNKMIASYPSREDFERSLIEKGLTTDLLRKKIEDQYRLRDIVDKYVKSRISISPKEISDYYLQHADKFYSPLEYIFYIAKSADKGFLNEIFAVIEKKGIAEAMLRYSNDMIKLESRSNALKPEIAEIIESLEVKQYKIAKVGNIFCLIFLDGKVFPRQLSLDEAKEMVRAYLWNIKFRDKFNQWVSQMKDSAVIENYYE